MSLFLFLEESPPAGTEAASGSETMAGLVPSDLNGDWSEMYESPLWSLHTTLSLSLFYNASFGLFVMFRRWIIHLCLVQSVGFC